MPDFNYAHRDNSQPERETHTNKFNKPRISEAIQNLRADAYKREIPVSGDETLCYILTQIAAVNAKNVLEIGTATGVTAAAVLETCGGAHITTIERDRAFYDEARQNFQTLGLSERVTQIYGDAGEVLPRLSDGYDFIFLDCAKVQYIKYLPDLKRLLKSGGTLFADDVLLYGYVTGEVPTPPKRKMLVAHIEEYIQAVTGDSGLITSIVNIGNGVALSVKI